MKVTEMKQILFDKFQDENCGFKKSDIIITKTKEGHEIQIKDFNHITFKMTTEKDDYFGFIVYIQEYLFGEYYSSPAFETSKKDYDFRSALVLLGYHIANTF